jgi:hypothetical protein
LYTWPDRMDCRGEVSALSEELHELLRRIVITTRPLSALEIIVKIFSSQSKEILSCLRMLRIIKCFLSLSVYS